MTLEEARKQARLAKTELARRFGVTPKTIYNYETKGTPVTDLVRYAYAGACGVPVDDLEPATAPPRRSGWLYERTLLDLIDGEPCGATVVRPFRRPELHIRRPIPTEEAA